MKIDRDSFPFITITFIFILFFNLGLLIFEKEMEAFIAINFWMFLAVSAMTGLMAYHRRDLPAVILPVTIFLLWVIISLIGKQEERTMVQINFLDSTAVALIAGICGILGTLIITLWKTWKDSKTIDSVKECAGNIKAEAISARGNELKNIKSRADQIHENMLSEVIPGMKKLKKLDNISEFVTRIDTNTQNGGGNIPLIFQKSTKWLRRWSLLELILKRKRKNQGKKTKDIWDRLQYYDWKMIN